MTTGSDNFDTDFGGCIRAFLLNPGNRRHFNDFFEHSWRRTLGCLCALRRRGFRLPGSGRETGALNDLAYDILGSLLRTEDGKRPFHILYDYFASQGIADIASAAPEKIGNLFTILLRSFVRQESFRITRQEDPQRANLKKCFANVFNERGYVCETQPGERWEFVYREGNQENLRLDMPVIQFERLQQLVQDSYLETTNRRKWCAAIFARLNSEADVQNRVRKHELVSAAVTVSLRYLEAEGFRPGRWPTPEEEFDHGEVEQARKKALQWVQSSVIRDFQAKGRISEETGNLLAIAADRFLTDLSVHGNGDLIPEYFREVMPVAEHVLYLEKYKYVFETIINSAVEKFREILQQ